MKNNPPLLVLILAVLGLPSLSYAAPGSCTGFAGTQRFTGTVMEYCDGTNWRLMGAPIYLGNPGCGASDQKQSYNTTLDRMEFCAGDEKFVNNCDVLTGSACAIGDRGKQRYNGGLMQYCNGSFWVNMMSTNNNPCCPDGFIPVPHDATTGTSYDFCVSKYHMKAVKKTDLVPQHDGGSTGAYFPESRPDYRPWRNINYDDAVSECASLGSDFHLITNAEWMTVAKSIESNTANWQGGAIGVGFIPTGHSDGFLIGGQNYLAASTNDSDGCFGTGNTDCLNPASADYWQKRTLTLSNGEVIWDFAGNINSWVAPDASFGYISYLKTQPCTVNDYNPCLQQTNEAIYSMLKYATLSPTTMSVPNNYRAFVPYYDGNVGIYPPGTKYDQLGLGTITWLEAGAAGLASNMGLFRGGYYAQSRGAHAPGDPRNFNTSGVLDRQGGIYSAIISLSAASSFPEVGFRCVYAPSY